MIESIIPVMALFIFILILVIVDFMLLTKELRRKIYGMIYEIRINNRINEILKKLWKYKLDFDNIYYEKNFDEELYEMYYSNGDYGDSTSFRDFKDLQVLEELLEIEVELEFKLLSKTAKKYYLPNKQIKLNYILSIVKNMINHTGTLSELKKELEDFLESSVMSDCKHISLETLNQ